MKGKSEPAVSGKGEKEGKKRPWHESIRSWWKGIPEICMDEIKLNPKSLQISCLILTHSSQVIAVGGGTMYLHSFSVQVLAHEAQEWTIQVIPCCGSFVHLHQSRNSLRVCSLQSASAENQYLIPSFFSWSFSLSLHKQHCLFMLVSFQISHWYPPLRAQ